MKRKPIAIASSDWHMHKFKNFDKDNSRLKWSLQAGDFILKEAARLKVPHLFCGDLFHTPKDGENETITKTFNLFYSNRQTTTYGIAGNHDMSEKNGKSFRSPSWTDLFIGMDWWAPPHHYPGNKMFLHGVEYFNDNGELMDVINDIKPPKLSIPKILMLHTDVPGASTPMGIELEEAYAMDKNLDKLFRHWDLVLCGHIHKPQRLSKKVVMLGPPIHQIASDEGQRFGYWIIYDDLYMEHIHLSQFPHFYSLAQDEPIPFHINDRDYIIRTGDEVEVEDTEGQDGLFHLNQGRKNLAKTYTKVKGIKSKAKTKALITALTNVE